MELLQRGDYNKSVRKMKFCLFAVLTLASMLTPASEFEEQLRLQGYSKHTHYKNVSSKRMREIYVNKNEKGELLLSNKTENTAFHRFSLLNGPTYTGKNQGEFGGGLYVESNGSKRKILNRNIVDMVFANNKLFILTGGLHGSGPSGAIWQIDIKSSPNQVNLVTLIPDAPIDAYLDDTDSDHLRIIILGVNGLFVLMPLTEESALLLICWGQWPYEFYPNSVTRYKDKYVIGGLGALIAVPLLADSGLVEIYSRGN